ncbi:MAG: DUF4350 domain-containing protein [Pseudonocardiaceae bacterium]
MTGTSLDRIGQLWRAARAPALIGLLVLLAALAIAVSADRSTRGLLDPAAVDGAGSRAVAELLRGQGVEVEVARLAAQVRAAGPDSTVFVAFPERLAPDQLAAARASAADLVVVAPGESALRALRTAVEVTGEAAVASREPRCELPAARAAGVAGLGGQLYQASGPGAVRCYPEERGAALVAVPDQDRTISVIGTPEVFTNAALATEGNAALAVRLLGAQPRLLWYLPPAPAATTGPQRSFAELVPQGWLWGAAQLAVAVLLAALWRGRRLGPVVAEPLPVVVRAAETVEGQGRLYRRAGARGHAAETLRGATRSRLLPLLGVPPSAAPRTVVDALAARTGTPAAEVNELLYGAAPADDAALVRLADRLDELGREVRGS